MNGIDSALVAQIADIVSWILIGLGSVFIVTGAIGLIRMPDVFTRMHASSVTETLGAGLLVIGLIMQTEAGLTMYKLLAILLIIFFTGPVVSHALAQAAIQAGIKPMLHEDRTGRLDAASAEAQSNQGRPSSNS